MLTGDRLFTGDTLLIGGTGRTDLPTGDPEALYDSLFNRILKLDPELKVFPAHDYKQKGSSTIAAELETNPRLQKRDRAEFVEMMNHLNLAAPTHLTEALRTNMTGGKTVAQLLAEAAAKIPFVSLAELDARIARGGADLVVLDVRERDAFNAGHVPGARHLPRGQLELRVNDELPDPTARIVTVCEFGKISTLAAATLRDLGIPPRDGARRRDEGLARGWAAARERRELVRREARRVRANFRRQKPRRLQSRSLLTSTKRRCSLPDPTSIW